MNDYFVKKESQRYFAESKTSAEVKKQSFSIDDSFKRVTESYKKARPFRIVKRYAIKQD